MPLCEQFVFGIHLVSLASRGVRLRRSATLPREAFGVMTPAERSPWPKRLLPVAGLWAAAK